MQSYIRLYKLIYETKSYIRGKQNAKSIYIIIREKPLQYISRISQTNQIVETFRSENPANQLL